MKFQRLQPGERPTVRDWNALVSAVEALLKMTGGGAVKVSMHHGVPVIFGSRGDEVADDVRVLKVSSVISSAVGRYNGKTYVDEPLTAGPITGTLAATDLGTLDASSDVVMYNLREVGTAETTHLIDPSTDQDYFLGLFIGVATDGRDVYAFDGGPADSAPPAAALFGTVSAYTPGSNSVTVTPDAGGSDIDVAITFPASATVCSLVDINVGDEVVYVTRASDGVSVLVSVPMPKSTTTNDYLGIAGSSGVAGFNTVRLK